MKRGMTLFLMTALLFSIVSGAISHVNPSQKASAQFSNAATASCQRLPIAIITARGNDGHVPANVLDNNLNTRWSNLGVGSFIQADLGGQKTICSVDIAWYRGNLRVNNFVISVSSDGTSFTNVFTGKSSGTTLSAEKFSLPTSATARFVRVTVNGNTENNWASITELSVDGSSSTPNTNCIKLPISSVTPSGTGDADDHSGPDHDADDGHVPANVLDNNLNTRWSNLGVGSFIQADLGGQKTICSVDIAWYRGNLRVNNFVISVSSDGTSFTNVFTGKSSGTTLSAEKFSLPTSATARFVRVTVNRNTENNWASVTELSVEGASGAQQNPTADNIAIQTKMNAPAQITLTGFDPRGEMLNFTVHSMPRHGNLTSGPTAHTVTYTPLTGFTGNDSFTYQATDGQRLSSNIATVTITVNPTSPPSKPTADNKIVQTNANTSVPITLTGTSPIPNDVNLKFSVVANPHSGTLSNHTTIPNTVIYTPNGRFSGTDSFTYKAIDGQRVSSNIATVTITVNPTSPPSKPTADNKIVQTNANTSVPITLTGTSPIPNDVNLKFSVVANPHSGTLSNHTTIPNTVIYTPNGRFSGTDSFTYKAIDGQRVTSNIATVTITVKAPPPPAPTVDNINVQTNKGTPIEIPLRAHDPIPGDMPRFSVVVGPQHGTVTNSSVSSSRFYTPATGFIGTDSFTYKATDSQGVDSNIATVTIIVSNATSGILDQFGIKQLNPSKPGGERWFFNGATGDPNNDPRTGTPNEGPHTTFTHKNPDGSWNVQASQVRYGVLTSTLFQENQIKTLNQQQMAAQGFMLRPNDWKNVELTAYLRVVHATGSSTNGAAHIEFGAHGARNTNGGTVGGFDSSCEATAYHSNTYLTGRVKFEKDLKHTAGYSVESADAQKQNAVNTTEFNGQNWIGIKLVVYDFGNTSVKVEQWVDDHSSNIIQPGNHWRKVLETVDHGQWGPTRGSIGSACGGGEFQIASWGGPIALFRWDNIDDMDIKNASVREIIPLA